MTRLVYGSGRVINQQVCNDRLALDLPACVRKREKESVCVSVCVCECLMKGSKT